MELKTKYQYTYFIYPYVIKENKFTKYLLKLLKDKKTMAFNKINGGTVDFNEKIWKSWYQLWMNDTKYYYAYVYDDEIKKYISAHADEYRLFLEKSDLLTSKSEKNKKE